MKSSVSQSMPSPVPDQAPAGAGFLNGAMAFAFALAAASTANAQQSAPPAERFQTPDGRVRFVLDRSGGPVALVRFEGSEEVHVLRPVPGPRGDDIFKTDTGDVLLRVTPQNSVIVYADASKMGAPATTAGRAAPVAPPQQPQGGLRARIDVLQREAARRLGRPLTIDAPDASGQTAALVADAAARATQGLALSPLATRVERVTIRIGQAPGVYTVNETVTITVAPQMGYAGRPSSAAVARAVAPRGGPVVDVAGNDGR
jgi:hypothetical protein